MRRVTLAVVGVGLRIECYPLCMGQKHKGKHQPPAARAYRPPCRAAGDSPHPERARHRSCPRRGHHGYARARQHRRRPAHHPRRLAPCLGGGPPDMHARRPHCARGKARTTLPAPLRECRPGPSHFIRCYRPAVARIAFMRLPIPPPRVPSSTGSTALSGTVSCTLKWPNPAPRVIEGGQAATGSGSSESR